jgi:hypothetical protein
MSATAPLSEQEPWPALPYADWRETRDTLHMWTQIVGKVRMALTPAVNHWWHVPLYLNTRGLTTSPIPYREGCFDVSFDFLDHRCTVLSSKGDSRTIALQPQTTAAFYAALTRALHELGVQVAVNTLPMEVPNPIRFELDDVHRSYDAEAAQRFWRILLRSHLLMSGFRGLFLGKASPVHFFWGSFDLAVTRFSGRVAPPHPGAPGLPDSITREAYSHEVSSAGFWPGGEGMEEPIFYAYGYPTPDGFAEAAVRPSLARWEPAMGEFVLPYEAMRRGGDPDGALRDFLQTTYEAAADLGGWDRRLLERATERQGATVA